MFSGTNTKYIKAFNEYLLTNNLTQAQQTGFVQLGQSIVPVDTDMFFDFLFNQVALTVIRNNTFLDRLDSLYKGNIHAGKFIRDIRTVLVGKEDDYATIEFEVDVANPFSKKKGNVSVVIHKVNAYKKLKVTVSRVQIQEAFSSEGGISDLLNTFLNDLIVQYNAWAYTEKRLALQSVDYAKRVPFEDYADFALKVKNTIVDMRSFDKSHKYNASVLYSPTSLEDIVIVMSEKFKNIVDIDYFTGLFNVSYAELKGRIIYIDEFVDENILCGIYDTRGLFFYKTLDTAKKLENPADLTENHWLHFWRMHSVSPHYNAVVLVQAQEDIYENENLILTEAYDVEINKEGFGVVYTIDGSTPELNGTTIVNGTLAVDTDIAITTDTTLKFITVEVDSSDAITEEVPNSLRVSHYRFV